MMTIRRIDGWMNAALCWGYYAHFKAKETEAWTWSCLCREGRHLSQCLSYLYMDVAEDYKKFHKRGEAGDTTSCISVWPFFFCVTLIINIIAVILLLSQKHNSKHFPYVMLANSYDNHGKQVLLFLYMRWENSIRLTKLKNDRMSQKADQALWKPDGKLPEYLSHITQR